MANQKISQMPSLTASELAAGDLLAVVDVSDVTQASSGSNKKITVTELQSAAVSAGTANGVLYLNGSKQATSGSALTFDGSLLNIAGSVRAQTSLLVYGSGDRLNVFPQAAGSGVLLLATNNANSAYAPLTLEGSATIFNASSSEQMRLTSTGLGIGTSSPETKLHVNSGVKCGATFQGTYSYSGENYNIKLQNDGPTSGYLSQYPNAGGIVLADGMRYYGGGPWTPDGTSAESIQLLGGNIIFTSNTGLTGGINFTPTERARIDSAGNLGLGVTPSAWAAGYKSIDFGGNASVSGFANNLYLASNAYDAGGNYIYKDATSASLYLQTAGAHKWFTAPSGTAGNAISFTQAMTLDASGDLEVRSVSGNGTLTLTSAAGSFSSVLNMNSSAGGGSLIAASQLLQFNTNGTERARIDGSGNLLVGTTTANSGIQSGANLIINGGGTYQTIGHANGTATGTGYTSFAYSGSQIGSITQNGTTAVAYNTSSDYRLKNITGPITTSGAYIDSLNPVEGTWKADGSTFVGLIAHEVQEASRTQVATGVKDGAEMQAMDYSNSELIANLIAEVKSLRARVAALESN